MIAALKLHKTNFFTTDYKHDKYKCKQSVNNMTGNHYVNEKNSK